MKTVVIVEDEAVSARRLTRMLEKENYTVLATLDSVTTATAWFQTHPSPDLLFLDVQLGDGVSFEIFEQCEVDSPIIFTTAYDQYALNAFKFNSIDYLLKPLAKNELQAALVKFEKNQMRRIIDPVALQNLLRLGVSENYKERFLVKIGTKLKAIPVEDIEVIYSQDKASFIGVGGRSYDIDKSLDDFAGELNPAHFFRISRKAWIQASHISEIHQYAGSRLQLKLRKFDEGFLVSRERVSEFKTWLSQ